MTVSTVAAIIAALTTGAPGPVPVAPGSYGSVIVKCSSLADRGVTLVAADPANPPVIAGLEVSGCAGLTFKGLDFTVSSRTLKTATIKSSKAIYIVGGRHYASGLAGQGVFFQFCASCGLSGAEVFKLGTGAVAASSDHITFAGNRFHDLTGDAMQTSATSYVTIDGNTGTDFFPPPGSHPDFYQAFTLGQTAPMTDFVITNNVYTRGKGLPTQGIFMGDEVNVGYQNIVITGNIINGAMYRGISPAKSAGPVVKNNVVQPWADMGSGIYLDYSTNPVVSGNRAGNFSPVSIAAGNVTLKAVPMGDTSALVVVSPPPPPPPPVSPPPPPPPPPVVVDPRDAEIVALKAQLAASDASLALVSADLARAVQAGSALAGERDALAAQVVGLTAERDGLAAKVVAALAALGG